MKNFKNIFRDPPPDPRWREKQRLRQHQEKQKVSTIQPSEAYGPDHRCQARWPEAAPITRFDTDMEGVQRKALPNSPPPNSTSDAYAGENSNVARKDSLHPAHRASIGEKKRGVHKPVKPWHLRQVSAVTETGTEDAHNPIPSINPFRDTSSIKSQQSPKEQNKDQFFSENYLFKTPPGSRDTKREPSTALSSVSNSIRPELEGSSLSETLNENTTSRGSDQSNIGYGFGTPDPLLVAEQRLYSIRQGIVATCPEDEELAKCLNTESAVEHLAKKHKQAIEGWTMTHKHVRELQEQLEQLKPSSSEEKRLIIEVEALQKEKASWDENTKLKDELIAGYLREKSLLEESRDGLKAQQERYRGEYLEAIEQVKKELESKHDNERNIIIEELKSLQEQHKESKKEVLHLKEHKETIRTMNIEIDNLEHTVTTLNSEKQALEDDLSEIKRNHDAAMQTEKLRSEQTIMDTKNLLDHEKQKFEAKVSSIRQDMKDLKDHFNGQMHDVVQSHSTDLVELKSRHQKEIDEIDQNARSERLELETQHKNDLEAIISQHTSELFSSRRSYEELQESIHRLLADQAAKHENEKGYLRAKVAQLEANAEKIEAQLRNEEREDMQRKLRYSQRELNATKVDLEALKGALVRRETFKGIPDSLIVSRFTKLAGLIDQFARIKWDKSKEINWPYPTSAIRQYENPRRLSQMIIQDKIWTVLYDRIFKTPFEMFGDESLALYNDWTSTFGHDSLSKSTPHWPEATSKSELFRYQAVQKCLAVVDQASEGQSVENQKRKNAYMNSIKEIGEAIMNFANLVAATNSGHDTTSRDIATRAAQLWLDICSQQRRIAIVVPEARRGASETRNVQIPSELVAQPALERVGDSDGEVAVLRAMEIYKR